jgi:hypothetical protein
MTSLTHMESPDFDAMMAESNAESDVGTPAGYSPGLNHGTMRLWHSQGDFHTAQVSGINNDTPATEAPTSSTERPRNRIFFPENQVFDHFAHSPSFEPGGSGQSSPIPEEQPASYGFGAPSPQQGLRMTL